jgi:hypothetical protein
MSRETSPYVVGDFWLDERRDGKSPGIWQIARYAEKSRSVVYSSTRKRDLEEAKPVIHAYVEKQRARGHQHTEDAKIIPQLFLYWQEHGQHVRRPDVIAGSMRAFIGFLMQDELGDQATIAELRPVAINRFRAWRMRPHSFTVPWYGKDYALSSKGVKGESVQRNIEDVRAALSHAEKNGRVPYVPKLPSVPDEMRSPPRELVLTMEQLGAVVGFVQAGGDRDALRWVLLMIATACRPEAALAFDPTKQWNGHLIDIHPPGQLRTKKRNPVLPLIRPLRPILADWRRDGVRLVKSRKKAWRTLRRALDLPADAIPKTIRHTIATQMRSRGVPPVQISGVLGHVAMNRTSEVYAKYDPNYLAEARDVLTKVFREVLAYRRRWLADHRRTKVGNNRLEVVERRAEKC